MLEVIHAPNWPCNIPPARVSVATKTLGFCFFKGESLVIGKAGCQYRPVAKISVVSLMLSFASRGVCCHSYNTSH